MSTCIRLLLLAITALQLAAAPVQPASTPPAPAGSDVPPDVQPEALPDTKTSPAPLPLGTPADLPQRLSALSPANPDGYLRLGEDIAAIAIDNRGRDLARTLFVLAFTLDRARAASSTSPTATSACLALAAMASTESDRRWLTSMARSMDRRLALPAWIARDDNPADSGAAYLAATFVGLVRGGDTIRATRVLAQPGVRDLLQRYERLLSPIGDTGGLSALEQEMARWPCPECAGKRIARRFQSSPPQYRLCSVCNGTLGPEIRPQQLTAQLRFESRLLSGASRSWAAQVMSDRGAPLRDVDPDELAPALGINPDASIWRDGRWSIPGNVPASGQEPAGR
ncbi:MAG: hypothetical protein IT435_07970 [Phycisphaerales bacterium]|nr:hypothetical protein [Phycisphaerales bacterium]